MTDSQRARFWIVLGELLAAMPDIGGHDMQPLYDAVNAELDKYVLATDDVNDEVAHV
jgi:hypothetical protein